MDRFSVDKYRYGTVIVNLANNRIITIVNSRETKDVQAVLDTFKNLIYLSRDRGKQYQKLSDKYIHIADRFHIIKNISEKLMEALKKYIPNRVVIEDKINENDTSINEVKKWNNQNSDIEKSIAHKNKLNLINEVLNEVKISNNIRASARLYKMSRTTIKRYLAMKDISEESVYTSSRRGSSLDQYKDFIINSFNEVKKSSEVLKILLTNGIKVKYGTLNRYINYNKHKSKIIIDNCLQKKLRIVLNRSDIFKKVFNWKCNDDDIKKYSSKLEEMYPIIKKYQEFYQTFKYALTSLDYKKIEEIFHTNFEDKTINSFLREAKKDDYEAIINSAKYKMNNGILEGTVNKIKNIKKAMYGRCGIKLLSKKVLYQSINYI